MQQKQADIMYMQICQVVARQSYAKRAQVGAIIVKGDNILSMGFNGTPSGRPNVCEETVQGEHGLEVHTKSEVLHAESNAFMKLVRDGGFGCNGATLYCTYSPCIECTKMAVQAGIKRVVYLREYRSTEGLALLDSCNVQHEQLPMHEYLNASGDNGDYLYE